jgi:serine/threonine-protein kinase
VRGRREIDERADIWALGVILYEVLSGASPFRGATLADTFVRIVSESHVPLRHAAPSVPAGLASLVESCLEKERERRPRSVAELARGLALYGGGALPARLESAAVGALELQETCADFALPPPAHRGLRRPSRGRLAKAGAVLAAAGALACIAPWLAPSNHARASGPGAPGPAVAAATVVSAPALASVDARVQVAVDPVPSRTAVHANSPPPTMRVPLPASSIRPALPRAPAVVAQARPDGGTPDESVSMASGARSGGDDPLRLDIRP